MTVWIPIIFTLLFALSACCLVMLAASMRALMPPTIPDISRISKGWPTLEDYQQINSGPHQQGLYRREGAPQALGRSPVHEPAGHDTFRSQLARKRNRSGRPFQTL